MSFFARFLIGSAVWMALFLIGWYVLGIHPSIAEVVLIALATGISNGVEEGLK